MASSSKYKRKITIIYIYFLMFFPFVFDFRSEGAGAAAIIQGTILLFYCIFLVIIFYLYSSIFSVLPSARVLIFVSTFFLIESAFVGLFRGQTPYPIFVNIIPIFLYASSAYVTAQVFILKAGDPAFTSALKWLCLLFVVSRVLIVLSTSGVDLTSIRYQILGSSTIAALGLIFVALFSRITKLDIVIILANLSLVLLSVTRTLIVVGAAQSLILAPTLIAHIRSKGFLRRIFAACLMLGAVIGTDFLLGTGQSQRWIERLFVASDVEMDPTRLTRVAEVDFMRQEFTNSFSQTIFGNGLAAETSLIGPSAVLAAMLVGSQNIEGHGFGFGHHNHWSLLFIGGLLAGAPLLILQFFHAFKSITFQWETRFNNDQFRKIKELGTWGGTIVVGTVAYGFYAGSFGDRGTSLWYGIGSGLLIGGHTLHSRHILKVRQYID